MGEMKWSGLTICRSRLSLKMAGGKTLLFRKTAYNTAYFGMSIKIPGCLILPQP